MARIVTGIVACVYVDNYIHNDMYGDVDVCVYVEVGLCFTFITLSNLYFKIF